MKHSREEKLAKRLLQMDQKLLDDAYETDNARKLKRYVKSKKRPEPASRLRHSAAIAGTCFALLFGLALISLPFLPMLKKTDPNFTVPGEDVTADSRLPVVPNDPGQHPGTDAGFFMDSMDKVNYYGGMRMILESPSPAQQQNALQAGDAMQASSVAPPLRSVSFRAAQTPPKPGNLTARDTVSDAGDVMLPASSEETAPGRIEYFDISEYPIRITTAVHFCIEVTGQDEFLASRIGTGTVQVVATELYYGVNRAIIITFKNGDAYYSCMTELAELTDGINEFMTHSYISGFHIVYDTTNETSMFRMDYDAENGQIRSFAWVPYNRIPTEAPVYPITVLSDTVEVSHQEYEFTLQELNDYYIPHNLPLDKLSGVSVWSEPADETKKITLESKEQMVALINCINSLKFENFFERDPGDRPGTTLIISISYTDGPGYGRATEIYLFDNTYIRRMGGCWKRISYEDSMALQSILFS